MDSDAPILSRPHKSMKRTATTLGSYESNSFIKKHDPVALKESKKLNSHILSSIRSFEMETFTDLMVAEQLRLKSDKEEDQKLKKILTKIEKEIDNNVDNVKFSHDMKYIINNAKDSLLFFRKSNSILASNGAIIYSEQSENGYIFIISKINEKTIVFYYDPKETNPKLYDIEGIPQNVTCLKAIGNKIWIGTKTTDIFIIDSTNIGSEIKSIKSAHSLGPISAISAIYSVCFSDISKCYVFTAASDSIIKVWNPETLECLLLIKSIIEPVNCFYPAGINDMWIATTRGIYSCDIENGFKTTPVDTIRFLSLRKNEYDKSSQKFYEPRKVETVSDLASLLLSKSKEEQSGINFLDELELNCIISLCRFNDEIWGCNHNNIICWDYIKKARVRTISCPFLTKLVTIGDSIYGFSLFGIFKWNSKLKLSTFSSHSCLYGFSAVINDNYYLIANLVSKKVVSFETKFLKHNLIPFKFEVPDFCSICNKSLRLAPDGFICDVCRNIHVHKTCLPYIDFKFCHKEIHSNDLVHDLQNKDASLNLIGSSSNSRPGFIAQSLFNLRSRFNPTALSFSLGSKENINLLREWINLIDLKSMDFEYGLRSYFSTITIPEEDEIKHNLIHEFSSIYFEKTKNQFFRCEDACFSLIYCCLYLNSAQEKHKSKRINLETWFQLNEGLNTDLTSQNVDKTTSNYDKGFLTHLYYQITRFPFEFSTTHIPVKQGIFLLNDKKVLLKLEEKKFIISSRHSKQLNQYDLTDITIHASPENKVLSINTKDGDLDFTSDISFDIQSWIQSFKYLGMTVQ